MPVPNQCHDHQSWAYHKRHCDACKNRDRLLKAILLYPCSASSGDSGGESKYPRKEVKDVVIPTLASITSNPPATRILRALSDSFKLPVPHPKQLPSRGFHGLCETLIVREGNSHLEAVGEGRSLESLSALDG